VDPSGGQLCVGIRGQGGSAKDNEARTDTQPPNAPSQVHRDQASIDQTTTGESSPGRRRQILKGSGRSTSWQAHSRSLRQVETKRSLYLSTTPNRNGEAERLSEQNRSGRVRPLSLRPSEGNRGTFSVAMREIGSSEGRYVAIYSSKAREPLILLGRESTIGSKDVVARHKSSPRNDQVRNGDREIGS
jgi:hypothetical protein